MNDPGFAISNRRGCLLLAAAAFLACPLPAAEGRRADISVSARLVLVPVTVTDTYGKAIPGLTPEHFRVHEDSEPRDIVSLSRQDGPASVGIVLDLSGSMRRSSADALAAARAIATTLGPDDESFLLTFGDRPDLRVPFTRDAPAVLNQLRTARAHGGTALVDAVWQALDEARARSRQLPALVVISDGGENASRFRLADLKRRAIEADIPIHSIAVMGLYRKDTPAHRPWMLEEISRLTGGLHFTLRDARDLPDAAAELARAMKERYLIAYRPSPTRPAKWRKVRVSVTPPEPQRVRVTARSGYYHESE